MEKLKVVVVPEKVFVRSMAGCGKNIEELCGSKPCGWTPGTNK